MESDSNPQGSNKVTVLLKLFPLSLLFETKVKASFKASQMISTILAESKGSLYRLTFCTERDLI